MAAAPDTTLGKQMEELLRCLICHETFTEPRTLGCFHSFCKDCLAKHVESQREEAEEGDEHLFSCPTCRTQFQLREGESVETLKPNFFIINLLEMLSIQERISHLHCERCSGQVAATCRCVDCEQYLCENCLTAHNKWPALSCHVVFTLEELSKPENQGKMKAKQRCHKDGHENKPLEYYCDTCQELACITCVLVEHPQPEHNCQPTAVVAKQQKEDLKITSAFLEEKSNEGQRALQEIRNASQNLQAHNKKAKAAVLQHEKEISEKFTSKLKRRRRALIVEADRKHNEVNQTLVKQHDDMEAYVEKVNGSLEFVKNVVEKGSNEDIVSLGNAIKLNANDIEKKCPKSMTPVHYGFIQYQQKKSAKNIVDKVDLNDLGKIVEPPVPSLILDGDIVLARQLAEWLKDKTFGWRLCYRATDDGWEAGDFHGKCDGIGPTVTLVKCGISVFGGYTDQSWESASGQFSGHKTSDTSFLFSLRNKVNIPPFKCPICDHQKDKAICCYATHGAAFGAGPDLWISSDANTNQYSFSNLGITYQLPPGYQYGTPQTAALLAGSERFKPTEIEVFRG